MKIAVVKFANGDQIITPINGTESTIKEYYKEGKFFNLGFSEDSEDNMQAVKGCEVQPTNELASRAAQLLANYSHEYTQSVMYAERNSSTTLDDIEFAIMKLKPATAQTNF